MTTPDKLPTMAGPALYRVRIRGPLDPDVAQFLGDLEVESEHDEEGEPIAALCGVLADQAALAGLLSALYTYHLPILSIECLGAAKQRDPVADDDGPLVADAPSKPKTD